MATERLANSAQTVLASAIDNSMTTVNVASATAFPGAGDFRIRIDDELMMVTGVSGTAWTVTRPVESTTATGHSAGAAVVQVLTAGAMNALTAISADQGANTVLAGPASGGAAAPAFRALATADLPDAGVTDAKLRDSAAASVIGRATGTSGTPADISVTLGSGAGVLTFKDTTDTVEWKQGSGVPVLDGGGTALGNVPLAYGGTGASLSGPGADRVLFWDESAGQAAWLTAGTGLTISGTTLTAAGSGGTVTSVTLTQPAAGLTITGSGTPITTTGAPMFALANDLAALEGLSSTGLAVRTGTDAWAQRTLTGTSNRITVTDGGGVSGNPTVDIASAYAGQTSITTLGTVATGTWQATAVGLTYGGTGANLSATGGTGQFLKQTTAGGAVSVAAVATADLPDAGVTNAKLRDSAALSVLGRSANSTGAPADIAAGGSNAGILCYSADNNDLEWRYGPGAVYARSDDVQFGTLPLDVGGTGASLSGPGADRVLFWDESAGQVAWLTAGTGLTISGTTLTAAGSGGTVTSVGLTAPSFLSVSGSPVTGTGTLALALANQSANAVLAGPASGSAAPPTFRALATADLPDAGVTNAKLRDSAALSVLGRSANSTGAPADIAAGGSNAGILCYSADNNDLEWRYGPGAVYARSDDVQFGTLPLDVGGTGASLSGPGADRVLFWDESAGQVAWLTAGTGLTISGTTLTAAGSGGTVTSASVVSANGFAGSVATATTTPAITLSTTITGILKGNGTAISAAVADTDYATPAGVSTYVIAYTASYYQPRSDTLFNLVSLSGSAPYLPLKTGSSTWDVLTIGGGLSLSGTTLDVSSSYAGQSSITTLGTVTTGVWNGTDIAVADGGTGASSASAARTNLGLAIGSDVQAYDADLSAIAALTGTNTIYYRSAANTWTAVTIGTNLAFAGGTLSNDAIVTPPNILMNGSAEIWQRGTSITNVSDAYTADRWYCLSETTTTTHSRQSGSGTAARYAYRMAQPAASAQRVGVAQIVESSDAWPYRNTSVRLQFKAKASTTTTIRFALLEWTGTADAVTSDVVNSWTNSTYTAGQFFKSSGMAVAAVGSGSATTTFGDFSLAATISGSCNNLIVFVWTESAVAQNVTVDLAEIGLYPGAVAVTWYPPPVAVEMARCMRFFQSSFAHGTAPYAFGTAAPQPLTVIYNVSTAAILLWVPFNARMRVAPTVTIYDQAGSSGKFSSFSTAAAWVNNNAPAAVVVGEPGFYMQSNVNPSTGINFGFWADAEL